MSDLPTPTMQTGPAPGDASYTTDVQILQRIAAIRANNGLPADPASDRIWLTRIKNGSATIGDARTAIVMRARDVLANAPEHPNAPATIDRTEPFDYREQARALMPYFPEDLIEIFAEHWAETGDHNLALTRTRQDPRYATYFPGNLRDDGTVRRSEADYATGYEALKVELANYNLPSDLLNLYPRLVEGGISPDDMRRRMSMLYSNIAVNLDSTLAFYAANFGVDVSLGALMASALDPSLPPTVFEERIRAAQIGGEGHLAGFRIDLTDATRLASYGLNQQAAREFFGQASTLLPTLGTLLQRHNDPADAFTLEDLEGALIVGDPTQRDTISRLFAQEQSQFSPLNLFQIERGGALTGLRQQ
jgi:hypothetical protein